MSSSGSARHRLRVAEAAALLVVAKVAVRVVPFDRLSRVLGERAPAAPAGEAAASGVAVDCRRAVHAAARRLPIRTGCLPRAIAGQTMLRVRGHEATIVFGLARAGESLLNHAWLEHEGAVVLGEDETGYTPTVSYRTRGRRAVTT